MKNVLLSKLTKLTLVSSLVFFACSTKASAEVNIKVLNSVIKSCQDNPPKDNSLFNSNKNADGCVRSRYHYILFMSKYNGLKNLGNLRPGFPSSLAIYALAANRFNLSSQQFLDCIVSKDADSGECKTFPLIFDNDRNHYAPICSSCFEAYFNAGSNWQKSMIQDLITWFYELDKPS